MRALVRTPRTGRTRRHGAGYLGAGAAGTRYLGAGAAGTGHLGAGAALLAAAVAAVTVPAAAAPAAPALGNAARVAPGAPGTPATWDPGDKDGFGTSRTTASKVWYTLNDGMLSEVYYPRIDTPSSRDTQLVVTDGRTFTDREDRDTVHRTVAADSGSLTFQQVNTAKSGRYRITKTYTTDPARSAVLVDVRFQSLTDHPYQVYLLHDVGLSNDGDDDTGWADGDALVASDAQAAGAVVASPGLSHLSSGYLGRSDGWTDLAADHRLDWSYRAPTPGNVVQVARTALDGTAVQHATVALGFGARAASAGATARAALGRGFAGAHADYAAGWHRYLATLRPAPHSVVAWQAQYWTSVMVLAASEDKTYRGGFVASPGRPWAWANSLQDLAVYHAVWSRDLYQIAWGLLAAGDRAAANRALTYLFTHQERPDGSYPQNSRLDGTPVFGGLQMDEVSFPIILAHDLGRTSAADWDKVRRSAEYIVAHGPFTPGERWENAAGYSPATIAAEVAGLVAAADIARQRGAGALAERYLATADAFRLNLDRWTLTRNGPYSARPYYLRITADGNANAGTQIQISDGGPLVDQRKVVDPSFLELVRLGVLSPANPNVRNTLAVVDAQLGYSTANGPFWHRASFDGYGEQSDGSQWEVTPTGSDITHGRGWPLLTGERGEYVVAAGGDAQASLDTMARAAQPGTDLMAEQVWDHRPPAGRGPAFTPGEPTFSATPLAWTHAQFVRLAWSVDLGRPVETPNVVACHFGTPLCRG